ncbi:putative pectinesterase/pectinesterase inhibitor 26 [Pseudolycoriella hygida]|uniref:pectinesterase n=1 Tax=Pseudolycoriella hygida TaxID=35572 RepID=A0A9Q0MS76_9DIPT|nr:putative pectinesterase/pectinesterase inhibitor 26 [Pseudolycoriella hygida]
MSLKNSYITAASTPEGNSYGFVSKHSTLLSNEEATSVYLGRPWRPYARTVFIHTAMGSHIHPAGWHNWNNEENEKTAFYAEYGVDVTQRVEWSKQLTEVEADLYTMENIFAGEDGQWIPNASAKFSCSFGLFYAVLVVVMFRFFGGGT